MDDIHYDRDGETERALEQLFPDTTIIASTATPIPRRLSQGNRSVDGSLPPPRRRGVASLGRSSVRTRQRNNNPHVVTTSNRSRIWRGKLNSAFNYDKTINYEQATSVGQPSVICEWRLEPEGTCCKSGRVKLDPLPLPPAPLRGLLDYSHPKATLFHQMIKSYNVAFQMTSFGANVTQLGQFPTTFRVQGQVCHRIGSLLPTEGQQPTFLQIYFVGDENDQAERRMQIVSGLDGMIVRELQNMLQNNNELVRLFKTATTNVDLRIQIHSVSPPTGEHPGRYNAPTSNEVAAILVDQQGTNNRDNILERHDNRLQRITETHRSYDALQYPLMFCYGTDRYSIDLTLQPAPRQMQGSTTRDIHDHLENADAEETEENVTTETNQSTEVAKRGHLTSRMYYAYRIQIRNDPSQHHLHQYRTLFNQYLVDQYAKI